MESMSKLVRRLTAKFYIFSFFDDFILIYPLYTVMFADSGLSPYKITSLLVAWSLTAFLLEVPAGALADKFPRRHVLIVGIVLRAIGYGFWFFQRTYVGFLIGFLLWGVKSALTSGTEEALVYDELNRVDNLSLYAKVTGKMQTLSMFAVVLASLGASTLAHRGYGLILVLSVTAVSVSGIAIYLLPKAPIVMANEETKYLKYLKEGIAAVVQKPKVLYIVMFMSVVAGLASVDEYFSLFFKEKGYTNTGIAFWTAVIFMFAAVGSFFAHKLEDKKLPLTSLLVLWAILLFFAAIASKPLAPILLGFYFMFFAAVQVIFNAHLQKEVSDKIRATATSVGGLTSELLALVAFGIVGFGASVSDYSYGYKLIAVAVVLSAVTLYSYNLRAKVVL